MPTEVPILAVLAVLHQGGQGELEVSLATAGSPPTNFMDHDQRPACNIFGEGEDEAVSIVGGSSARITGRSSHEFVGQMVAMSKMASTHRNHLSIRYVDEMARVRVLDAYVNASSALEEGDVRLPLQHPATADGSCGWWNSSAPRGLLLGFERVWHPPDTVAESLFIASGRWSEHVVCLPAVASRPVAGGETVEMTNETGRLLVQRHLCRRALTNDTVDPDLSQFFRPLDCSRRRVVREAVEDEVLQKRRISLPVPHPQGTSCGMFWHVKQECNSVRECVVYSVNRRWWSTIQPYYLDKGMDIELQYRAPGTRLHHRLTLALQPFTTNTSCFVVGASRSRQYSATQNHGEGMCALAALMQACGHGRALQIQSALCPSLLLAECRLQPGDEDETTKYHLTDYEATALAAAFTEQGTPDRFFPYPPPRS